MKKITICGKQHNIDCNALTYIKYREKFNRGIFDDIKVLKTFLAKQVVMANEIKKNNPTIQDDDIISNLSKIMIDDMDLFVGAATRIAYIMIYTADEKIEEYEKWLKNIPYLKTNDDWIAEVTEFAVDCFC